MGGRLLSNEFVQEVRKFATECGALLAFDEMQAGFGRTGKLLVISIMELRQICSVVGREPVRAFHLH